MRRIRCSLLKIGLLILSFAGMVLPGMAQNSQPGANAVVYNQSGIGTSILIVFAVLVIILFIFKYFGKLMAGDHKKTAPSTQQPMETAVASQTDPEGEIHAAIAMALYLYSNELHDQENPVITMIRVSKTYSPWSSKIYGLRKSPR